MLALLLVCSHMTNISARIKEPGFARRRNLKLYSLECSEYFEKNCGIMSGQPLQEIIKCTDRALRLAYSAVHLKV